MDVERNPVVGAIGEASRDVERLPWALAIGGASEAAAALWLLIYKKPGGMLVHHGVAVFYSYYVLLAAVLVFGLVEAWVGYRASCDLANWRAAGKTVMWCSIFPLVLVAGLGGPTAFAIAPM